MFEVVFFCCFNKDYDILFSAQISVFPTLSSARGTVERLIAASVFDLYECFSSVPGQQLVCSGWCSWCSRRCICGISAVFPSQFVPVVFKSSGTDAHRHTDH